MISRQVIATQNIWSYYTQKSLIVPSVLKYLISVLGFPWSDSTYYWNVSLLQCSERLRKEDCYQIIEKQRKFRGYFVYPTVSLLWDGQLVFSFYCLTLNIICWQHSESATLHVISYFVNSSEVKRRMPRYSCWMQRLVRCQVCTSNYINLKPQT